MNRPEARPLSFKTLSLTQKQATEKIAKSLLGALDTLPKKHHRCQDQELDPDRSSRIFFVSGEPGSGKTTLYLTLRKLLDSEETIEDEYPKLKKLRGANPSKLVWLEPLDLEPFAQSPNFLAAIFVRIDKELDGAWQNSPTRDRSSGFLEPVNAVQEFRRLQNDVVLSWDGDILQRTQHIDSEALTLEILRTENARLRLNQRLRQVFQDLIDQKKLPDALYILPVDDFYLNPSSSLEFLRLLRMISVPRLFILILGELYVIEELFYQYMLGQLVGLAGEQALNVVPAQVKDLTARAGALTSHAFRKLVPPAQRSELQTLDQLQALEFSPGDLGEPGAPKKLRDLLKEAKVNLSPASLKPALALRHSPQTLYEFLVLRKETDEKIDRFYTYSGLEVLDLPPREVVDLWFSLDEVIERPVSKDRVAGDDRGSIFEVIIQNTLAALAGQTYLSSEDKGRCEEAIQGTPYFHRTFVTSVLALDWSLGQPQIFRLSEGRELILRAHQAWSLKPLYGNRAEVGGNDEERIPGMKPRSGEGRIDYLAPRPRAWFTVLHDLMALAPEGRVEGRLVPDPFKLPWVSVSNQERTNLVFWPTPAWRSFWHYDKMAFSWRRVLDALKTLGKVKEEEEEARLSWLAYNWLSLIARILVTGRWDPKRKLPKLVPKLGITDRQWKRLVSVMARLVDIQEALDPLDQEYQMIDDWLCHLCVFLDPRFAITREAKDAFHQNEKLATFWAQEDQSESIARCRGTLFGSGNGISDAQESAETASIAGEQAT